MLGACSSNSNDNSAFAVSENSYHIMCTDTRFVDKLHCTKAFLSRVFVQVNVESSEDGGCKDLQAQNFVNEDRALMRFEFLEAIVRIAVAKYKEDAGGDVSEALEILMHNHIDPFFNHRGDAFGGGDDGGSPMKKAPSLVLAGQQASDPGSPVHSVKMELVAHLKVRLEGRESQTLFDDPNAWRVKSLYHHTVDEVLKSHQRVLDIIFGSYSKYDVVVRNGVSQKAKSASFSLQCWMDFLEDCRLISTARNFCPWGKMLSHRDAKLCFFLSRMTVVDEVKHRGRCMSLNKLEFYEALCRVAEILSEELPMAADLVKKAADDIIEYEIVLNRESKVSGAGPAVPSQPAKRTARRLSMESASGSDDDAGADNESMLRRIQEDERKSLFRSRRLFERLEMLLRVMGGRLGMRHQGQLQNGKQFIKFIPRYIAKQETLKLLS